MEKIKGYCKSYSVGKIKRNITICGHETVLAKFVKGGEPALFIYVLKNKKGEYVDFDIREIYEFPKLTLDELRNFGLDYVMAHITQNQNLYKHLI